MYKQIIAILIASAVPMISFCESAEASRPSKLKVTGENPGEGRFRQRGEPYSSNMKRKVSKRVLVAQADSREKNRDVVAEGAKTEMRSSPVAVPSRDFESIDGSSFTELRTSTRSLRRTYNKNNVSLELLGRGALYSVNYDRLLGRSVAMGVGFSYMNVSSGVGDFGNLDITIIMVPLYANYYMNSSMNHRVLGTAGVTIANARVTAGSNLATKANRASEAPLPFDLDTSASASVTIPLPMAGLGYEYRSQGGFLARLTGYGVFYGSFQPWVGLGLGSHF